MKPVSMKSQMKPKLLKYWVGIQPSQSYLTGDLSKALVGYSSSDGVTKKIPYGVNALLH